jgi:predicted kinase
MFYPYSGNIILMAISKLTLAKPVLIYLYGFPGAGKSYVARNLVETLQAANVSGDRIRSELFESPRYDTQENAIVTHLMNYMAEEFLSAGVSVIFDTNALRTSQRRNLRELARRHKAESLLVWLQIDPDTAFSRTQNRDRRTSDDRYAQPQDRSTFEKLFSGMQNPQNTEDYLVISGKHNYSTQKNAIVSRLYQLGLVSTGAVQHSVAKPGLVNLVPNPNAGRVDLSRRNIVIR